MDAVSGAWKGVRVVHPGAKDWGIDPRETRQDQGRNGPKAATPRPSNPSERNADVPATGPSFVVGALGISGRRLGVAMSSGPTINLCPGQAYGLSCGSTGGGGTFLMTSDQTLRNRLTSGLPRLKLGA